MADIIYDKFTSIEDDIEKVQQNPTVYISFVGPDAVKQMFYEVTNNMIDEHGAVNSISEGNLSIMYDKSTEEITFQDDGRGINFDDLEIACTKLQAGTKMSRQFNQTSGGENGIGLTVCNALSELFEITSTANGRCKFLKFREGKLLETKEFSIKDKTKHGLIVSFIPSKFFLGEDAELPLDAVMDWLEKQSFQLDPQIKLKFVISGMPGTTMDRTIVYQNTVGIMGYLPRFEPDANLLSKPVHVKQRMDGIMEDVRMMVDNDDGTKGFQVTPMERFISIDVAFNFNPMGDVKPFASFCNNIETIEGGEHESAVRSAIVSYLTRAANDGKGKSDITQADVLAGLRAVVILNTNLSTRFENQTKHKLGNREFYEPIRKMVYSALQEYFKLSENRNSLSKIISFLKTNASLRANATKARAKIKTQTQSFMDCSLITGYTAANLISMPIEERRRKGIKLVLYVAEGDSAGAGVRNGRYNPDVQGVLKLRGVPDNIYKKSIGSLESGKGTTNSLFLFLFKEILGCGYGRSYNEDALQYDYIFLLPDADIDGDHIASIIVAGIYKFAPKLITNNHLYRVIPPLYRINPYGKQMKKDDVTKSNYLYNKMEIYGAFADDLVGRVFLKHYVPGANPDSLKFMSNNEFRNFVIRNRDYRTIIRTLNERYRMDYDLIEYMASHENFAQTIQQFDKELHYNDDGESISGSHNGKFCSVILNDVVMSQIKQLRHIIAENDWELNYHCYERVGSNRVYRGLMSIGYIMDLCQKYYPTIVSRYKGIGEMSDTEIQTLLMDPKNQRVIRLTIDDSVRATKVFDTLFLDEHTDTRKKIIGNMTMSLDELDN